MRGWTRAGIGRGGVAIGVSLLLGCATDAGRLRPADLSGLARRVELSAVAHFPQEANLCGPSSLATVLGFAGIHLPPSELTPWVFTESKEGSLPLDMLGGARRAGAMALQLPARTEALIAEVSAGRPVVVLQNLSLPIYPRWHYAVVVGYDLDQREVILRSGRESRQVLPMRTFEHTWARSERWAMLALAPGALPRGDFPMAYAEAALALERLDRIREARLAYEAGLVRWPHELALLMGAGNTAYAMADREAAEHVLRRAVQAHPDSDAALNNLAHVLAERDALDEALLLARRAVQQNGASYPAAVATMHSIEERLSSKSLLR